MTLLQLAHAHCDNWQPNGSCLGAMIDDDLVIRRCIPRPKCLLGTPGRRCWHFEECILPLGRSLANPKYQEEFQECIRQYRLATQMPSPEKRACPACGQPMEPRARYCPTCAAAKRRKTYRQAKLKSRVTCPQLTENGPLNSNGLQGPFSKAGMEVADHVKSGS